jgi:hypothetical protein
MTMNGGVCENALHFRFLVKSRVISTKATPQNSSEGKSFLVISIYPLLQLSLEMSIRKDSFLMIQNQTLKIKKSIKNLATNTLNSTTAKPLNHRTFVV